MALKERLINPEESNGLNDVNDLDLVYLEQLKKQGLSDEMIEQFKNLLQIEPACEEK